MIRGAADRRPEGTRCRSFGEGGRDPALSGLIPARGPDQRGSWSTTSFGSFTSSDVSAYLGASVGGIGTPVGTPPNLIGIGMLETIVGTDITFFQWMLLGVPIVVVAEARPAGNDGDMTAAVVAPFHRFGLRMGFA